MTTGGRFSPAAGTQRKLTGPAGRESATKRPNSSVARVTTSPVCRISTTASWGGTIWPISLRDEPAAVTSISMLRPLAWNDSSRSC